MIKLFSKVTDSLYRGSSPTPKDLDTLKNKYNIERVVSLDKKSGEKLSRSCKILGLEQIIIPLDGKKASLIHFLTHDLKDLLDSKKTFIHCSAGKDRTGLACAMFKIKNLNTPPKEAFKEACEMGFGVNLDPKVSKLYRECILNDVNDADIVSNQREYKTDSKSSYLEEAHSKVLSPFDGTREFPEDKVYQDYYDQDGTREKYYDEPIKLHEEKVTLPLIGVYNNDAGARGMGPVDNAGGFIYV